MMVLIFQRNNVVRGAVIFKKRELFSYFHFQIKMKILMYFYYFLGKQHNVTSRNFDRLVVQNDSWFKEIAYT